MSKTRFCNLLFRYISEGFITVDIETKNDTYMYDFNTDYLFLANDYFTLTNEGAMSFRINYKDVKSIIC
ncbi:hypothetical protein [Clostridium sp.]|uniref:hypothetical protein n=1 Tax=Clostridium sp. TaxID=1506 RepID=UPI001E092E72|nr:hypothetical protein [Clostridium sp.]MBS5308847.1 hypothetical protein [Clostridium sp.]